MGYQILYYFDHYDCCELKTNDQETFKNHLFENVFQARIPLTLYCNGKILASNTLPCSPSVIRVQTPLLGGKGGFGANLRRQAHNRVQKTSINLGSCRDLNGNRMKYVNAAIAMKRWRETMEKYQSLMDEGKEAEAKEYMKEASKQGINGWYAEIPSWFDGVKTVKHDELRAQLKAKMCKDWLRAREGRQPPKGAPSYWGCPRGKHCPYAHGHEELIGEGKREYEKEQEAKKNAEITEKMNNYMDYSSTTEEQMSNSVSNGMKLALENRKRRKVEKQNRTVNSRMNTLLNPTLLRKMPPLLSRKSPTPSEPVKETKQVETISVQDSLFNNKLNILEGNATINEDGIITGTSSFCSIRLSNTVIISGLYYFEVHILTDGLIQIGWADSMFVPNEQESNGVGDDDHSWSYDGIRQQKWFNGESTPYGEQWKVGDVIGCMIDADKRTIQYTLNGKLLKPAFEDFQHFGGVFPVCSLEEEESILVNLGQCQFEYDIPYGYKSLWELSPIMS